MSLFEDSAVTAVTPGQARLAAGILVGVWVAMGRKPDDYDLVWRAKEYLHDRADELEGGGR